MTRDELIRMAREAEQYADKFCSGIGDTGQHHWFAAYNERFAALVAASEREACAEMVDHILKEGGGTYGKAIRARGEQEEPR